MGSAPSVQALVPRTIALRGVVTNRGTGVPLNRTEPVLLTLYDVAQGRTRVLWQERQTVRFLDGAYHLTLGASPANPLLEDLFSSGQVELGMTIGDDVELQPRLRIHSVPFAFEALTSENVTGDITPQSVTIRKNAAEFIPVIDQDGRWIGDPEGLQGTTGARGPSGATGSTGATGATGVPGVTGATGASGTPGPPGHQGHQGHQGLTGRPAARGLEVHRGPPAPRAAPGRPDRLG